MTKVIIEFLDAHGLIVKRHEMEGDTATQEEFDEAVELILDGGCDARTAMVLVKQGKPND